ncbi:MAG: HNH endonuclease signature motif containing protein [Pseudomonadota bacterium]
MKRFEQKLQNLIGYSVDSSLARAAVTKGFGVSKIKESSLTELKKYFGEEDAQKLKTAVARPPIPPETVKRLIEECDWKCCVCRNYDNLDPVVIHHIIPWSGSRSHDYDNLVILCGNHHTNAHETCSIAQDKLPPAVLRSKKERFISDLAAFNAGTRCAPGREKTVDHPEITDTQALQRLSRFFRSPAMHQPFHQEGNMRHFYDAVTGMIKACATGILKTRDGEELASSKSWDEYENSGLREGLKAIAGKLEELRTAYETAVRQGDLIIMPDDPMFYELRNPDFPRKMDSMRNSIITDFNRILKAANLNTLDEISMQE